MKRQLYNIPEENNTHIVKKAVSPIQKQRIMDGSPLTINPPSKLKPIEPGIIIKGSLAEKLPPATFETNTDPPQFCERSFSELVKSFLNS